MNIFSANIQKMGVKTIQLIILMVVLYASESQGAQFVIGVKGKSVEMPCHMATKNQNDRPILALWYKQGRRLPVYSFDARKLSDKHQADKILEGRSKFVTNAIPARLVVSPVLPADSGMYTCRVDYEISPTRNTAINLTIIEPPEKIIIKDEAGNTIRGKTLPINEGSPLSLSCIVTGGRPPPKVTWWSGHDEFRNAHVSSSVNRVESKLKIPEVKRSYNNKGYYCKAKNNDKEPPLTQEVIINMNLRPLRVSIKLPTDTLKAGIKYTFECESRGSKPSSSIAWFIDGVAIDTDQIHVKAGSGDSTAGYLTYSPKVSDDGKMLKCQAWNPAIPGSAVSNEVKFNIHYTPIVKLKIGKQLQPQKIKQGDDVYFECTYLSNPMPHKISWYKDGTILHQDKESGTIVQEESLVLQKVSRSDAGVYTCEAFNTQGRNLSNEVKLDIMFAPECAMESQPTVLAVGKGETVNISCKIASNPLKATFRWQLNGSERTYDSHGKKANSEHLISHYKFVGTLDKDYGSLLCWANNSVGNQKQACIFSIIPAGPPSSPENCKLLLNHTAETIDIFCQIGFDGGLRQNFLAEIYDEKGSLHANLTSLDDPLFCVESSPDTNYMIKVFAFNSKGRSQPVHLSAYASKVAEKRMGESQSLFNLPLIIIFVSIIGGFIFLILTLVLVTRWRRTISNHATVVRIPNPPPLPESPIKTVPSTITLVETPGSKKSFDEIKKDQEIVDKVKPKPKKKVMVMENGKIERPGITSPSPELPTSRDNLVRPRENDFPNSSSSYYSDITKVTAPSSSSSYHTFPSSNYMTPYEPIRHLPSTHQHHSRTLPQPGVGLRSKTLPPLVEEYPPSFYNPHYSSLPRRRPPYRSLDLDGRTTSVEDRYHLVPEWKGNPKYLIRTRDRDSEEESFV